MKGKVGESCKKLIESNPEALALRLWIDNATSAVLPDDIKHLPAIDVGTSARPSTNGPGLRMENLGTLLRVILGLEPRIHGRGMGPRLKAEDDTGWGFHGTETMTHERRCKTGASWKTNS